VEELTDYKFFCFNGVPMFCQLISNRTTDERIDFYDMEWNHQVFTGLSLPGHPFKNAAHLIRRPKSYELMKRSAALLSAGLSFLRVDFYEINGNMYFGELTFFPMSGFGIFEPNEWNEIMGSWIKLPNKK
jgi:hypothetical protein